MYALFEKHRTLKLIGIAAGLLIASYFASPAVSLIKSKTIKAEDMIGLYYSRSGRQLNIATPRSGRLVSEGYSAEFSYEYQSGTYACRSKDGTKTWTMRVVGKTEIFNNYDSTYLIRYGGSHEKTS
jgi:hypothetical protein